MYLFRWSLHVCFISVTNCYHVKCSLCQYMSMYVYHVDNGDGNLNCIICARSFLSCLWQINMYKPNQTTCWGCWIFALCQLWSVHRSSLVWHLFCLSLRILYITASFITYCLRFWPRYTWFMSSDADKLTL